LSGTNLVEPCEAGVCDWYEGPTFVDILDQIQLEPRFPNGPLRIPVLDKMKEKGLTVHGKVENGTIRIGERLAIMPSGNPA
jgi:peptide chain release factor subunit 3